MPEEGIVPIHILRIWDKWSSGLSSLKEKRWWRMVHGLQAYVLGKGFVVQNLMRIG